MADKVYIQEDDGLYSEMFAMNGFHVVDTMDEAGLICFTGGADVSPHLYGQPPHLRTHADQCRDSKEIMLFNWAKESGKAMVGICRGGQLLNVLNGGTLFQDVDKHGHTEHMVATHDMGNALMTSDHHQMMIPSESGQVFMSCVPRISSYRVTHIKENDFFGDRDVNMPDIEGVYYEKTKCMCYQPHPEWVDKGHDCQVMFFRFLTKFFYM